MWDRWRESYEAGVLAPLGRRFSTDSIGSAWFPMLAPVEGAVQSAAAEPAFRASLGQSVVGWRSAFESTPIDVAAGIGRRFTIGATIPFVTSIARVDATIQHANRTATVGINPALATPAIAAANGPLLTQLDAAAASINARIASCGANPSGAGCGAIVASPAAARAVADQASALSASLGSLYGGRGSSIGALFVPLAGGSAHAAIAARIQAIKSQLASFGAPAVTAGAPVGAPAPITTAEFRRVLTDSTFGVRAAPLASIVRRGIGDVTAYAQFVWHEAPSTLADGTRDARWWRSAASIAYRAGTGASARAADLTPVALGDHQADIELTSVTDVALGRGLSVTTAVTFTVQQASDLTIRVPASLDAPIPEAFRTLTVTRDLGEKLAVAFYPRWSPSEAVSLAGHYGFHRRGVDRISGTALTTDAAGAPVTLDASLSAPREASIEHRIGASVAYSTLAAHARGEARWPLEVAISHFQTTAGPAGSVPKLAADAVTIRWYWRGVAARPRR